MKYDYINDKEYDEVVFAGKSNAGKSSLINKLCNNGKLARVSKQPGKTRLVNFFTINGEFFFVDLPGYGFARVSKEEKATWDDMMRCYFESAVDNIKAFVLLMDIRHGPSEEDKRMLYYAEHFALPYIVVATKADKIAKSKRKNECVKLRKTLPTSFEYPIIPVSSQDGYGIADLLEKIGEYRNRTDA